MNLSLQDKPCSNQMADSWFLTAVISHFYSAVYLVRKIYDAISDKDMVPRIRPKSNTVCKNWGSQA